MNSWDSFVTHDREQPRRAWLPLQALGACPHTERYKGLTRPQEQHRVALHITVQEACGQGRGLRAPWAGTGRRRVQGSRVVAARGMDSFPSKRAGGCVWREGPGGASWSGGRDEAVGRGVRVRMARPPAAQAHCCLQLRRTRRRELEGREDLKVGSGGGFLDRRGRSLCACTVGHRVGRA